MQTQTIPLAKLEVAPENARAGKPPEDLDALAANIEAYGQLQPLIAYPIKGGRFAVCAGRRRLAALAKIKAPSAEVRVCERAQAFELSISENEQRVQMSPLEQAEAWASMVKDATDLLAVANAFGVTERLVQQRIKLASLVAPIKKALVANELSLAAAEAYASAPPERQAALFKRHGARASRFEIRDELAKGKLASTDRLAVFVGEEAYLAAGGRVEVDLFANSGTPDPDDWGAPSNETEAFWIDREIVDRLVDEKIAAAVAKLEADGWGFVETGASFPYGRFTEGAPSKTKEDRAKAGCFVSLNHQGKLETKRGLLKGKAAKLALETGIGKAPKKPKAPPMTNTTHEATTRIASRIVGRQLATIPSIALVALVAQMARAHFDFKDGDGYVDQNVLGFGHSRDWSPRRDKPIALKSDAKWEGVEIDIERELEQHAKPPGALEEHLATLTIERVLELLAFFVGAQVACAETSNASNHKPRRAKLAALARLAHTEPAQHWTPDKAWLMGLDRGVLEKTCREFDIPISQKKGVMCDAIAAAAASRAWTPPLLAELVGLEAKPAPAKKPVAKKSAPAKRKAAA